MRNACASLRADLTYLTLQTKLLFHEGFCTDDFTLRNKMGTFKQNLVLLSNRIQYEITVRFPVLLKMPNFCSYQ